MEKSNYTYSVIMPCFNSEAYLKDALNSVLNQSYKNLKLIAINDGSTDHTLEILEDYASRDSRITIISKENGGYVSAVNAGLNHVESDYFLMMGSDDALATDLIETINEAAKGCDSAPDCIVFQTEQIFENEKTAISFYTNFDGQVSMCNTTLRDYSEKYPQHAAALFCRDTSKCFKSGLLGDLRYFGKYGIAADGIFSILFCRKAESFLSIPCVGYLWNVRNGSVSSTTSVEKVIDQIENLTLFFDALKAYPIESVTHEEKHFISNQCLLLSEMASSPKQTVRHMKLIRHHGWEIVKTAKRYDSAQFLQFSPRIAIVALDIIAVAVFLVVHKKARRLLSIISRLFAVS